jgi:hypothetical protein
MEACAHVREMYVADWRAELRNAPHFTREDKKPWTVDHFTKPPVSSGRTAAQEVADQIALMKARMELGMALKGNPDMVPGWAKGPYLGTPKRKALNG